MSILSDALAEYVLQNILKSILKWLKQYSSEQADRILLAAFSEISETLHSIRAIKRRLDLYRLGSMFLFFSVRNAHAFNEELKRCNSISINSYFFCFWTTKLRFLLGYNHSTDMRRLYCFSHCARCFGKFWVRLEAHVSAYILIWNCRSPIMEIMKHCMYPYVPCKESLRNSQASSFGEPWRCRVSKITLQIPLARITISVIVGW